MRQWSTGALPDVNVSPQYSIIIPAYNESARILGALHAVVDDVHTRNWTTEILIVNDGSQDDTALIVQDFAATAPEVRLLENPGNRGKGYSVRAGMLASRGQIAMFTDADLSTPLEDLDALFAAIEQGADVAIGSRWLERRRQTQRQPLYRQILGRCFNYVTRALIRLPFVDTQCGFKAFTRAAIQEIFPLQTIERWGFDPEILFIALQRGCRVAEVPVSFHHDERTQINYFRDGIKMLEELAIIRWNALTGRYGKRIARVAPKTSSGLLS